MTDPSPRLSVSRRLLLAAGAAAVPAAVLVPTAARAEDPVDPDVTGGATRVVDVPLGDVDLEEIAGTGGVRTIDRPGTMLGVTWTGAAPDRTAVRGLAGDGTWGTWYELHEALDPMTGETIDGTEPAWLGPVTRLQVRATRDGQDVTTELTAHVVTTSAASADGGSARTFAASAAAGTTVPGPNAPAFVTREGWGADESLTGGVSTHAQTQAVVVHHTEGSNSYTAAQSAQIIRGILTYHTQSNGWADVGYNAFVDKYGQIFEGRKGGLLLNVTGAHARGVNSRTFGISLLGSYTSTQAPAAAREAIAQVAAWRLISAFHPTVSEKSGFPVTVSGLRYPEGSTMSLPRLFSHRDVNLTDCPGTALFNQLDAIRSAIQTRLDGAWRVHLDAFTAAGGEAALGTVTQVAHTDGDYTVTVLTKGLVLSDGDRNAVGYATTFATSWRPAWGRPTGEVTTSGTTTRQTFQNGTVTRQGDGPVSFEEGPAAPVADGVYRVPYGATLYSVSSGVATALSGAEWAELGYPAPAAAPTAFVRYSWSATISAVTRWGDDESGWTWQVLDGAMWRRAGSPPPRAVAYVGGSVFYAWSTDPSAIFVEDPGGVHHQLTYAEWVAAGSPVPERRRNQGFQKLRWDASIARMTDIDRGVGSPIGAAEWARAGYPAPQNVDHFPGERVYLDANGVDVWYSGPSTKRRITYAEWKLLGFPAAR